MRSMTGYGSGQASNDAASVTIEVRSVNSRYLDLQFRMPDELRMAEMPLRELIAKKIARGKVDVRASYARTQKETSEHLTPELLGQILATHQHIQRHIPSVQAPAFADVLQWSSSERSPSDPLMWVPLCLQAGELAVAQLMQTRQAEGTRLVELISAQASDAMAIVTELKKDLPALLKTQADRIATRIREAFEQACPQGLSHIRAEEISERLAAEASIFSLRADVAEELDRLELHLAQLRETLGISGASEGPPAAQSKGIGKRLDFLFQEMNREANTLGSKAVDMRLTRASIDLKLLIEQMREQIQNIE